jgi:hypothetical protein
MNLEQVGTELSGTLTAADGATFPVSGHVENDSGSVSFSIPPDNPPRSLGFRIDSVTRAPAGMPAELDGQFVGRCCGGTLLVEGSFTRETGA